MTLSLTPLEGLESTRTAEGHRDAYLTGMLSSSRGIAFEIHRSKHRISFFRDARCVVAPAERESRVWVERSRRHSGVRARRRTRGRRLGGPVSRRRDALLE